MGGFGDFSSICNEAPLPLCPLVGDINPITGTHYTQANCYARSVEVANTIIFEGAAGFAHIIALIMTVIMIIHVRSKFTAVGRKEIATFFYLYGLLTICSLLIDCGVVPPASGAYAYFVAVQLGLVSATCICLMINGFVGFQLYEDGTTLSIWLLRVCSLAMFIISFAVSLLTFQGWAGLSPDNTIGLFVVVYIFSAIFIFVYIVMLVLLVLGTLQERWPLLHIIFGVLALVFSQVILYAFSEIICDNVAHYFDALFLSTLLNLLAVMLVYKFWDAITQEDLEFSVGQRQNNWEVKALLPEEDRRETMYMDIPVLILVLWLFTAYMSQSFPTLQGKRIVFLIAHPDDEAMFFAPVLQWLSKPELGNQVLILCLSSGDADGLGHLRKDELAKSAVLLGVKTSEHVVVVEDEKLPDSMEKKWDPKLIASILTRYFAPKMMSTPSTTAPLANIDAIVTFDTGGVSGHPNHISLFHGASLFLRNLMQRHAGWESPVKLYTLTSVNMFRKYSSILDSVMTIITCIWRTKERSEFPTPLLVVSGPSGVRKAQRAMTTAHESQMRWFRWGWIGVSRYMVVNDLRREKVR
ncbi:chitin synthase export chaperone [Hortaea werneckii]|nr:chitin synthase export chaperone [Hortaea werneckii]KAI7096895.1 chitin synthase export chaperone [Hortaea werneckii]KAI7206405.1 chitin synthase export chaperone [Hortaea werneckii]KAI7319859.1 chitin synthase export chaperone [Hortaea werneckii]KAI7373695.1 chitin synthase export chaperone [Hortaea werneckii]